MLFSLKLLVKFTTIFKINVAENKRKIEDQVEAPISKKRMEGRKCVDLIVLGLPWKTTEEDLTRYFEKYGELVMAQVRSYYIVTSWTFSLLSILVFDVRK